MDRIDIKHILERLETIAMVGLSRNPEKYSYQVAKYLQTQGYHVIPINPNANHILGETVYATLAGVPAEVQKSIEIISIFRPSEEVPPIVEQIIQLRDHHGKPDVVWMQLGIVNHPAAEKAQKAGVSVVMDKCIMQEHKRLIGEEDAELEEIKAKKMAEMVKQSKSKEKLSAPITITDTNFTETVEEHPLIIIDCWAPWCGPCRIITPIIEELAKEHAGEAVFGKLNVDENPQTASRFNIMGIPTLLIVKDGKEIDRIVGAAPKSQIESKLKKYF
jgi:thioredoxin 1